jgi:hypothetical protein
MRRKNSTLKLEYTFVWNWRKPNLYLILLSFSTYIFIHTTTDIFQFLAGWNKEKEEEKHNQQVDVFKQILTLVYHYCLSTSEHIQTHLHSDALADKNKSSKKLKMMKNDENWPFLA